MKANKFHTRFSPPPAVGHVCDGPSRTEQHHKRETEINGVVYRFMRTGILGDPNSYRDMHFGDFSQIGSYQDAQNAIVDAKERFSALPAKVRAEFDNDPGKLLAALSDGSQLEKLVKLGLVSAPAPEVGTPDNPAPMKEAVPPAEGEQKA